MPGIGEGNGNPLQYSYLENPVDGGAWWAAVCGVARSRWNTAQPQKGCDSAVSSTTDGPRDALLRKCVRGRDRGHVVPLTCGI